MKSDILHKLAGALEGPLESEAHVVYILVEIRKLLERAPNRKYDTLRLCCDWALHVDLWRNKQIVEILERFDKALENGNGLTDGLISDYVSLSRFHDELADFVVENELPTQVLGFSPWQRFLALYADVVSDCPIYTGQDYPSKSIREIRIVTGPVRVPESVQIGNDVVWLQWRVECENGQVFSLAVTHV
jgi:enamine deaminase RidA (YjgF/YER057c/UK114 family)